MASVISTDNYTKTSCLQVFLYTNCQRLYRDAVKELLDATHQTPIYALCPSFEHKQALTQALYESLGYTNFSFIGTLEEGLLHVLKYECQKQKAQLHDTCSVCMAIYELLSTQDPSLDFLKINQGMYQDYDTLFEIAQSVAKELISIVQLKPDIKDPKFEPLVQAIKRIYPEIFFLHEAFLLCAPFFHKMRWVGFTTLPEYFIDQLSVCETAAYLLVPSLAFLGDIISAKQKLKDLRDQKNQLDAQFVFSEHPLLESFSNHEKSFYKKLGQLDHVYVDHMEEEGEIDSLNIVKKSLKDGLVENFKTDRSLDFVKVKSFYEEAVYLCGLIQRLFENDTSLTQNDILVVADSKIYGPILNAVGQSMQEPISFSESCTVDPFWDLIDMLLSVEASAQDQNYFLKWGLCYLQLHKDTAVEPLCYDLLKLFKTSHLGSLNDLGKGTRFLVELAAAYRRSLFFEIDPKINCYEFNFLSKLDIEDPYKVLALLDDLSKVFDASQKVAKQRQSIKEWIEHICEIIGSQAFAHISCFEILSYLIEQMSLAHNFSSPISSKSFFSLFRKIENKPRVGPEIKINPGMQAPCFEAKWIFYLGAPPVKQHTFTYFEEPNFCQDLARFFIHQANVGLIWIYDHKKEEEGSFRGFLAELFAKLESTSLSSTCLETASIEINIKKPFFDPNFEHCEILEERPGPFAVDIKKFSKFVTDKEGFIKKHFLKIAEVDELLDVAVAQRNLKKWHLKQYGSNFSCKISDPFLKYRDEDKEQEVLRSNLVQNTDHLSQLDVCSSLQVDAGENHIACLTGVSLIDEESKLCSKRQLLLLYKKLETYFFGT